VTHVLPEVLPLFPLPATALFPGLPLPLHVFEPRYKAMVKDALEGSRIVGMLLLRPGWENDYLGRPSVFPIGCAGQIRQSETLSDGRYNLVLVGLTRFEVIEELAGGAYRQARVNALPEREAPADLLAQARARLTEGLERAQDGASAAAQPELSDVLFVNALAQSLPLDGVEQQSLLDCAGALERCRRLTEIVEFKLLERSAYGRPGLEIRH